MCSKYFEIEGIIQSDCEKIYDNGNKYIGKLNNENRDGIGIMRFSDKDHIMENGEMVT